MSSVDDVYRIERYPDYEEGELIGVSYGCPGVDLMGFSKLIDLLKELYKIIEKKENDDLLRGFNDD